MTIAIIKWSNEKRWALIFHLILWSLWIGLPLINSLNHERFFRFNTLIIPVALTNIPLFLLNSEWLIPKVFLRKGLPAYLFSLLGLVTVFAFLQLLLKEWIIPPDLLRRRGDWFWAFIPVLFVTALSTGYGIMVHFLRQERIKQEEQRERLQSELSFLRSQISPHFFFNMLNSIVYLIRSKSPLAEPLIIKLSELMRYMLYQSSDTLVPLEKEVAYLKNYVELQQIRFGEDVDIRLHIDEAPLAQVIEPMLMIPFVENAFKHGVGMVEGAIIDIRLRYDHTQLEFTVNNKIGPESPENKDSSSGIGLRNVRRRLELLYPDSHRLDIEQNDQWFRVKLWLRFSHEGEVEKKSTHEVEMHSR
jgi:two-component system LytT family sensor kinase